MPQTQMGLYDGIAPGLNSTQQIDSMAFRLNVVAKTAAYTVLADESGTVFTTLGALGAVIFTLPAPSDGLVYWFFNAADQDMTVTAAAVNIFVLFNDLTATSFAFAQAAEHIGGGMMVVSDGTYWYGFIYLGKETQTTVVV